MQLMHLSLMLFKLQIYSEFIYKLKTNIANRYTERKKDGNRVIETEKERQQQRDKDRETERQQQRDSE